MQLFLAVTLYDDRIHGRCSESMLKNVLYLMKAGHTVTPFYNSDLYIDRSRNTCVNVFMDSGCSDMVFWDSDLSCDDDSILKLIKYDRPIVAGAYPYKKDGLEYPVTLDFSRGNNCKEEATGLVYAKRAPTGLMRIHRSVFEQMIDDYDMVPDERGIYPFFDTGVRFSYDPKWYGEDAYFCKRWCRLGYSIFVEPRINFIHSGMKHWSGNYHEYLMGRRIDTFIDNMDKTDGIRGWTTEEELTFLGDLAFLSNSVVEVGSWKGRSTKVLLHSCPGTVYAVDHWLGSQNEMSGVAAILGDVYQSFLANVGHYPNLQVEKGSSIDVAARFNGNHVDMVFIDAGHTYEECKSDIEAWLPKCKKFICGHDYDVPSVKKAVDEKFGKIQVVDTVWFVDLEKEQ